MSETIVIVSKDREALASFETRHALDADQVGQLNAVAADDVIRSLAAVHVPVNSRGEAVAFVRNASERQVAVFFDGASLNVPWDNRLDLSLIPAGLIGDVRSAAGPLAPHYGVNTHAALSLRSGTQGGGSLAFGSGGLFKADLAFPVGPGLLGGGYSSRNGQTLPDDADLPYSQNANDLRTNTDRELANLFGHLATDTGLGELGLTAFQVWGNKGIAPEGNAPSGARYWRYSDIAHTLVTASLQSTVGPSTELNSTGWFQRFGQTIDSYTGSSFEVIDARQVDRDTTWGIRELVSHRSGNAVVVGSFNFLDSKHRQRETGYLDGTSPVVRPDALFFSQHNWSIGAELEYALTRRLSAEVGIGYDVVDYVETGDKPPVADARDWTGRAALLYEVNDGWILRGAVARKMRAASMRELFGTGINRFLANEDLQPEQIVTAELGSEWRGQHGSVYIIPFIQDLNGTIDERRVGALRQRINLGGSTVKGLEVGGNWYVNDHLSFVGNATWSEVRRKETEPGALNRIAEKPSLLASLLTTYEGSDGFVGSIRVQHMGRAYSVDDTGALVPLDRSTSIDLQVGYGVTVAQLPLQVFLRVDNAGDEVVTPQIGLPGPGRTVLIGIKVL